MTSKKEGKANSNEAAVDSEKTKKIAEKLEAMGMTGSGKKSEEVESNKMMNLMMVMIVAVPVLAIVAAVGALAAGLVFFKKNWIEVSDAIGGTIEQIQINFENSIVGKLFDKIGSLAGGGESKIALDINVNDKAGNVDNIESSSATAPGVSLNVGQNMGMAL